MFTRFLFGSEQQASNREASFGEEIELVLDIVFNKELGIAERKQASFALKSLSERSEHQQDFCKAYARCVSSRCKEFESMFLDSQSDNSEEQEDIAQTLMDIVRHCSETSREACLQHILLPGSPVLAMLLQVCAKSSLVWVRVSALEAIKCMVHSTPREAIDKLLSVPSALETLLGLLQCEQREVRNELVLLLLRLTEDSEQMRMFVMFCDGPVELFNIALEESTTGVVSGDCIAVITNSLHGNLVGQKQFVETQEYLNNLTTLLEFNETTEDPTPSLLRVGHSVELVRILCQGRVESQLACVKKNPMASQIDTAVLKQAQTKLGATPHLLERLFQLATYKSKTLESQTKQNAVLALGDLICKHSGNASRFERLGGFTFLAESTLLQQRWGDCRANIYAWICALDNDEQRAIALIGSAAVATENNQEEEGNAVSVIAQSICHTLDEIVLLRKEIYVDPVRVQELRSTFWKACRMWELLLGNSSSAKEMALRIEVSSKPVFAQLCDSVPALMSEMDEPDTVKALVRDTISNVLRVLTMWLLDSPQTAVALLSSAANLVFFEPVPTNAAADEESMLLLPLIAAACLVEDKQLVAFGLVENKMGGVAVFLDRLNKIKRLVVVRGRDSEGFTWQDDTCTHFVVDPAFAAHVDKLLRSTDLLLVKGSSSSGTSTALSAHGTTTTTPVAVAMDETKLQRDHAKLLLALTCKQVEIESLLQSIQTLAGKEAKEEAQRRAQALVSKALEGLL